MCKYTIEELMTCTKSPIGLDVYPHDMIMANGADHGYIKVVMTDGVEVDMPARRLCIHAILWHPLWKFTKSVTTNDIYTLGNITPGCFTSILSRQYNQFLDLFGDDNVKEYRMALFKVVEMLQNFVNRHLGKYTVTLSIDKLIQTMEDSRLQKIVNTPLDPKMGTDVAEAKLKVLTKELIDLLSTRGEIKNNHLIDLMETGSLNKNQIPQMLIAYGARADIDDTMMYQIINSSAMEGLKNTAEFAIESLSAKKAAYFNKVVIKMSQYMARVMRLNNSTLRYTHKGDCGAGLLPVTIEGSYVSNYIDKVVRLDGVEYAITSDNLDMFKDKRVEMRSPLLCRHKDGICEACTGRNSKFPWAWVPSGIHLGLYASSKFGSAVSQMVLSAKHLIKTMTIIYILGDIAKKVLMVDGPYMYFKPKLRHRVDKLKLRIPSHCVDSVYDMERGVCSPENFSKVREFELLDTERDESTLIDLTGPVPSTPYLSEYLLDYMKEHGDCLKETEDGFFEVPLDKFDPNRPIFAYIVLSDDMVTFTKRIRAILTNTVTECTTVESAIKLVCDELYSKTSINIFFVELMMRSFVVSTDPDDIGIGVVDDYNAVEFGTMQSNIEQLSISAKLGHEKLKAEVFGNIDLTMGKRGPGLYDELFGIAEPSKTK